MAGITDDNFVPNVPPLLPRGCKFSPDNGVLIEFYLKKKILGKPLPSDCIPTVEVYSRNPTQLPLPTGDFWRVENEWYFFTTKPHNDSVTLTNDGYYSVIKEEETIKQEDEEIGFMRTLAYFQGTPPSGKKSKWTIYEFRVKPNTIPTIQHDDALKAKVSSFVVCKLSIEKKKRKYTRKNKNDSMKSK
ncbi:hypothetical protein Patl1_12003 [Pistacia atlantica]|uniref:Uncharacterized protein n=1 Tax=Pistacia atlantica TaxID=434234 RepID=A0ACC1A712_9ROSI|nr:hypothetical protein Patl1_12003 [Pistacia atlantica]